MARPDARAAVVEGAGVLVPDRAGKAVTDPPKAEASQDQSETEEDCHLVPLEGPVTTGRLVHERFSELANTCRRSARCRQAPWSRKLP